jgi:hypothetical protein
MESVVSLFTLSAHGQGKYSLVFVLIEYDALISQQDENLRSNGCGKINTCKLFFFLPFCNVLLVTINS